MPELAVSTIESRTGRGAARRVLFVSHAARLDGAERGLFELARSLKARGHDVAVLLPEEGPLVEALREASIETRLASYPRWARDRSTPVRRLRYRIRQHLAARRLATVIAELAPDVVITNTVVIPAAAMAARRLGIPHVWYLREFGAADHGLVFDLGLARSARTVDRLSDVVIVNCNALRDYFSEWIPREHMRVVYNAVELGVPAETLAAWRRERPRDSSLRCVLLGNIRRPKGQEEAIRAIASLARRGVDAHLALVGGGNAAEVERLRALCRELGVADRVELTGHSSEPLKHLCRSDVALVCSTFEAFGRVAVEALKCGCPVVCTDRGGVVEHVEPGVNGFVYPSGDPEALADHLARLAADPPLVAQMSHAAIERANERYDRERQVAEVEETIEDVLTRRGA